VRAPRLNLQDDHLLRRVLQGRTCAGRLQEDCDESSALRELQELELSGLRINWAALLVLSLVACLASPISLR
jgi:hypothetical protein